MSIRSFRIEKHIREQNIQIQSITRYHKLRDHKNRLEDQHDLQSRWGIRWLHQHKNHI